MPKARAILTLILTTAWLLAMNHCRLEALPSLSFLPCVLPSAPDSCHSGEDADDGPERKHGCHQLEGSMFRLEDNSCPIITASWAADQPQPAFSDISDEVIRGSIDSSVRPGLRRGPPGSAWRFLTRAAGRARSPSLLPPA